MKILIGLIMSCLLVGVAYANDSSYSNFDIDKDCAFEEPASDEDAGMGARGICKINRKPDIYFYEGDLRQTLGFGAKKPFETFGVWNSVNNVVEWRHDKAGKIQAAIVRFFIEQPNPKTGEFDKALRSQILVVHKVAPTINDQTCVVGLIDARLNKDANILARQVADTVTAGFNCSTEQPIYHGNHREYPTSFYKTITKPEAKTDSKQKTETSD